MPLQQPPDRNPAVADRCRKAYLDRSPASSADCDGGCRAGTPAVPSWFPGLAIGAGRVPHRGDPRAAVGVVVRPCPLTVWLGDRGAAGAPSPAAPGRSSRVARGPGDRLGKPGRGTSRLLRALAAPAGLAERICGRL